MAEQMEIILNAKQKSEATVMLRLLNEMTPTEQKDMLIFMQGVRFAKVLERETATGVISHIV